MSVIFLFKYSSDAKIVSDDVKQLDSSLGVLAFKNQKQKSDDRAV